ncbi:MAG: hypothetical protein U9Q67_02020 [Patescibacteria group bacterium]|nr:hypothetical protein [Patescibacteria group bacterium]
MTITESAAVHEGLGGGEQMSVPDILVMCSRLRDAILNRDVSEEIERDAGEKALVALRYYLMQLPGSGVTAETEGWRNEDLVRYGQNGLPRNGQELYSWNVEPEIILKRIDTEGVEFAYIRGSCPGQYLLFGDATVDQSEVQEMKFWGVIDVEVLAPVIMQIIAGRQKSSTPTLLNLIVSDETVYAVARVANESKPPSPESVKNRMSELVHYFGDDPDITSDILSLRTAIDSLVEQGLSV